MGPYSYLVFGPTLFGERSSIKVLNLRARPPRNCRQETVHELLERPELEIFGRLWGKPKGMTLETSDQKNEAGKTKDESVGGWKEEEEEEKEEEEEEDEEEEDSCLVLSINQQLCTVPCLKRQAGHLTMPIQRTNSQRRYASRSHFPIHMSWAPNTDIALQQKPQPRPDIGSQVPV